MEKGQQYNDSVFILLSKKEKKISSIEYFFFSYHVSPGITYYVSPARQE